MARTRRRAALLAALLLAGTRWSAAEEPRRVVMVSVDGLMPAYFLRADELGLRIPTLRRLMARGAYGRVTGVLPTVTYPSHTTLITGVPPRRHGIVSNTLFDPEGRSNGAWMWYASSVRVPSLVTAARARGLRTAAVSWPVSVGLPADQNMPEFARNGSDHPADLALLDALSTPGLLSGTAKARGAALPYPFTDGERTDVALHILRTYRPRLLLLHIFDLDHEEHENGPLTPRALQAVEEADAHLGRVLKVIEETGLGPTTLVAVVSDHGFLPVSQSLRPNVRLREAGLVTTCEKGKAATWRAWFHVDGGSAALHLKDPADKATLDKVRALFAGDAGRAGSGVQRILEAADIERMGGDPDGVLTLDAAPGFSMLSSCDGAYLGPSPNKGTHGYGPDRAELQAALIVAGPGVTPRDLGVVPMTGIAPAVAHFLGLELSPDADRPLDW